MKYVLVTGSNRGIGLGIIGFLIKAGYGVIAHYRSECQNIERLYADSDNNHLKFKADLRDIKAIKEMFGFIRKKGIELYGLVNNAGIVRDKMILWMNENDWDEVMDVNLKGSFFCIKNALSLMIPKKRGRIINIVSPSGILGREGQANYSASKGGLIALTKSVAREVGQLGITSNAVCPGVIKTRMYEDLKKEIKDQFIDTIPLKRPGEPEEVAGVVEYLLREESAYISGSVIKVDGGLSIS